jgi:protease IV
MRRTLPLLLVLAIVFLGISVSIAQTESDKSNADTSQAKAEQAEKDKGKDKDKADKSKSEKDSAKSRMESVKAKIKARMEAVKSELKAAEAEVKAAIDEAKSEDDKQATPAEEKKTETKTADKPVADKEEEKTSEKKSPEAEHKKTAAKKTKVVCLTLRGEYPEGPVSADLFSEMRPSLSQIIDRIDSAAKDKDIAAVWLKFDGLEVGRGKINELRAAILRLRKANKPVYAELTNADAGQYLIACACNEIVLPESGALMIPGVRAEVLFYKGLLDKIGVEFEDLKMGKYKGALEPLTRRDMSQPLRESLEAIVDDIYNDMSSTIAADRGMEDLVVKSLMDHGLFTAEGAKKAGLIDQIAYADEFEKSLEKKLNAGSLDIITKYKTKNIETDFSGFSGMMKFMELVTGTKASETGGKKQKIAIVYAVGTITEGKSSSSMFGETVLGSKTLTAALRKAAENPKVAAVVLRIDSPGGSATASDLIWRETTRMGKPLIASMGDVAGSGGYYIAMGADKIYAEPGTLTGSIGVIGAKLVLKGLFDKLGLNAEVISRGANSGAMSSLNAFTPEERRIWQNMLKEVYRQFVSKAAKGRKMSYEKLDTLAQGRVYSGTAAKKLGLIDELGTLNDAIIAAKTAAGLKPDADVDLLILPEPRSIFEQLFGDSSSDVETDAKALLPFNINILEQTKILRQFFTEPVLLWMPYKINIQ